MSNQLIRNVDSGLMIFALVSISILYSASPSVAQQSPTSTEDGSTPATIQQDELLHDINRASDIAAKARLDAEAARAAANAAAEAASSARDRTIEAHQRVQRAIEEAATPKIVFSPSIDVRGLGWWLPAMTTLGAAFAGAFITYLFSIRVRRLARVQECTDVTYVTYSELVELVGRCWYDFRDPWQKYAYPKRGTRHLRGVVKFRPNDAVVFQAFPDKLSLLPADALAKLLRFHAALDQWRREIDQIIPNLSVDEEGNPTEDDQMNGLSAEYMHRIARRLAMTLQPGLEAIEALRALVPSCEQFETNFVKTQPARSAGTYLAELRSATTIANTSLAEERNAAGPAGLKSSVP